MPLLVFRIEQVKDEDDDLASFSKDILSEQPMLVLVVVVVILVLFFFLVFFVISKIASPLGTFDFSPKESTRDDFANF